MAKLDPAGEVICDAGPLIHLDELGCFDLLSDFAAVLVPEAVWQEVERHQPSALRRRKVKLHRCEAPPQSTPELKQFAEALLLASGEFQALQLVQQLPEAMLLTDDAAARIVAERLGREVHGTIGVVTHIGDFDIGRGRFCAELVVEIL